MHAHMRIQPTLWLVALAIAVLSCRGSCQSLDSTLTSSICDSPSPGSTAEQGGTEVIAEVRIRLPPGVSSTGTTPTPVPAPLSTVSSPSPSNAISSRTAPPASIGRGLILVDTGGDCMGLPNTNAQGDLIAHLDNYNELGCCNACKKDATCNVYVFCASPSGCGEYPFKRCSLKRQELVVGGTLAVYGTGSSVPWTSGYLL